MADNVAIDRKYQRNFGIGPYAQWVLHHPIWAFVVIIFIFFSLGTEHFFSIANFQNVLVQTSTIGLIALGMTLVMINGNIDLSVGAVVAFAASLTIDIMGWPVFEAWGNWQLMPAVLAGLLSGIVLGALNGFIVWKTGIDAFIVTLGAMLGVRGLVFVYTNQQSFYAMNFAYSDFGGSSVLGLPTLALIFLAVHGRDPHSAQPHRARIEHLRRG